MRPVRESGRRVLSHGCEAIAGEHAGGGCGKEFDMSRLGDKQKSLARRKMRVRRKIHGTSERPRLSVFRSLRHIHAQIIDDSTGHTLVAATTLQKGLVEGSTANIAAAASIGKEIAQRAQAKGVKAVVFDRSGLPFHGRVKALADAAREAGLDF